LFRNYWLHNYQTVKTLNPRMPFVLRDFDEEDANPYLIVKYGAVAWALSLSLSLFVSLSLSLSVSLYI
jgi:hypothetical protein